MLGALLLCPLPPLLPALLPFLAFFKNLMVRFFILTNHPIRVAKSSESVTSCILFGGYYFTLWFI